MHGQQFIQALAFAIVYVIGVLVIICFWVWLTWQFYKAMHPGKYWNLPSKVWFCRQCWYYAYLRKTMTCPKCAQRYKQGEHWIVVEDLTRGQPKKVEYYKSMQQILLTESED